MGKNKTAPALFIKAVPTFALIGGISLLILLGASVYYASEAKSIRSKKQQELKAISGLKIGQVVQWRNDKIAVATFLSKSSYLSRVVEAWLDDRNNTSLKNEIVGHLSSYSKEAAFGYSNAYLASTQGESFFSAEPGETILNTVTTTAIREAIQSENISFTDFYQCSIHDKIHYDIIAPIFDRKSRPIAALVFRIDPDDFLYPLIQSWPTASQTSETLLVRKDGADALYLNELRLQRNTALALRIPLTNKDIPAVKAVLGFTGISEGRDYRGVKVLSYIEPVPGTPWFMVAKVDTREIYAEIRFRAILIGVVTVVLILFTSAGLALIYYFRQKNIYKKLLAADKKLQTKQEEYKTALYSIGDGVMTTDIKGNVVQMNPVAEQLTGWLESEAKGKPLEEIFRIINEETRSTVANPVQKVIQEGLIVGLANHTLLISKNGKEIPIADSGAPIKNEAGEISGVILVFRDQTPEREASRALQQSEATIRKKLKAIIEPDGDIGSLELSDIIDVDIIQPIMEDFYRLTGMLGGILDTSGKIIVAIGWQDICIKFHRCNKDTHANCIESDTVLTKGVQEGQFKAYHCKNNMWDIVTPLIVGNRHLGNVFIGQFLYNDEQLDTGFFRNQARRFGFDEDRYLEALEHVPRFSKEAVDAGIQFYARLTGMISRLSFSAIQQSRLLAEHERAEISVKQSEAKFRTLFENSPIGMSISGVDGYSDVNKCFCTMLGYDPEELMSKKWQEISHPDDVHPFTERIQSLLEGNITSTHLEKRYLHKNGTTVWAEVSMFLQRDEKGKPQFFITAINDITRRKKSELDTQVAQTETRRLLETAEKSRRVLLSLIEDEKSAREEIRHLNMDLEQRVIERTSQLEAANKELEAFSYSVSHDLRTPLRHITSYAEILMTGHSSELSEKAKHYLDTIKRATITMGTLIDNLLQFSRMGKAEMLQRNCSMDDLLANAMDQIFGDSAKSDIQLDIAPLPVVFCDFNLLVQVWVNLLSNAVKYSRGKSPQIIKVGYTEEASEFVFFVSDNGIGFEMEYVDKLFGVFQRLHSAKEFEGTGIGLANVRRIITRHHGRTWAESTPGQGAKFYFSLPKNPKGNDTPRLYSTNS